MTAAIITEPTNKREYYSLLSEKEVEISKDCGEKFVTGSRKASEGILEAGEALIKAKKELGHGKFMWFCQYELPLKCSHDTINNFINTAKLIKQNPALAKFNPSIIFQLAKPSTPSEVVEEMTALAKSDQHQGVKVKDVQQKVKKAKVDTIKKGDIVEWPDVELKGYNHGRVVKISNGIIKLQTLSGTSIGERPAKFISKCPVQKQNSNPSDNLEEGDLVTIKPYVSWLQTYRGKTAKVIHVQPKKLLATILLEGVENVGLKTVLEFHWEELEKIPPVIELPEIIDIEVTEITNDFFSNESTTPNDLKKFMADYEANVRKLLCHLNGDQFDYLLEMVLKHKDDIEQLNARYKWDE